VGAGGARHGGGCCDLDRFVLAGSPCGGSAGGGTGYRRGVLEFAVRDLQPKWFQQVLFARLERMQTDQVSALDQAMLGLHADLAAQFAAQDAANEGRFAGLAGQLSRVLDRLPPGIAIKAKWRFTWLC